MKKESELLGWDYRGDNPSWYCRPWSIYKRLGNRYDLYRMDALVGTFDRLEDAAEHRMRIVKDELKKLGGR